MSAGALEVVREIYDAFARRDGATSSGLLHADVEFHQTELLPWGGHFSRVSRFEAYTETPPMLAALAAR